MQSPVIQYGVNILGSAWGTHFCVFYQTKDDLLDILVPYFRVGLENNEYCMWVTSEPLYKKDAEKAMRATIPNFEKYLQKKQIEIIPYTEWYVENNEFDIQRVLKGWVDKCKYALDSGFKGLRLTGNTFWLEKKDWKDFTDYEQEINEVISSYNMTAVCTYSLEKCGSIEILDVVRNHQYALFRREGSWEVFKSSEQTKIEQKLKESEERLKKFMESATDGFVLIDSKLNYIDANKVTLQTVGMTKEELIGKNVLDLSPNIKETGMYAKYLEVLATGEPFSTEDVSFNKQDSTLNSYFSVRAFKVGDDLGVIFTDITETKKAEQILKESEQQYRVMIESINDPIHIVDKDLQIVLTNQAYKEYVKTFAPNADFIGKKVFEAFPYLPDSVLDEYQQVFSTGKTLQTSAKVIINTKDVFTEITKIPIFRDGRVNQIMTIGRDVTDRKKAEEEIMNLAKFPSENPNPVFRATKDSVIYANQACEEVFYIFSGEILPQLFVGIVDISIKEDKVKVTEIQLNKRTYSLSVAPIKNTNYANIYGMDITERKKIEEQLRDSEKRLFTLLDGLPAFIYLQAPDYSIRYANQHFQEKFGNDLKRKCYEAFNDYNKPCEDCPTFKVFDTLTPQKWEWNSPKGEIYQIYDYPFKDLDGSSLVLELGIDITEREKAGRLIADLAKFPSENPYPVLRVSRSRIMYVNDSGQQLLNVKENDEIPQFIQKEIDKSFMSNSITESEVKLRNRIYSFIITPLTEKGYLNIYGMDITEKKQIEENLKEINKLKTEFLRRASHELKTPLISIKGFSDLILSLYADQLDPVIITNLREINDGCERLQNIINDLLETSRLESPELKPKLQKEDLSFLIQFCVHELESLAEGRNQSIELDIHNNLYVNVEKEEIHDVLSNLLSNAIKYTPPMGKIEIRTELQEKFAVISVKDNGIGFTGEQKKKIFKKFGKIERYGQGLDLGIDGTGLGLYISKRIVESHGGKIWMESEGKDKGASFYFTLPIVK